MTMEQFAARLKRQWCLPPQANGDVVWHREDGLEVYSRPYHPRRPQVCRDEAAKQLLRDARTSLPAAPGSRAWVDYEYERGGGVNIAEARPT